MKQFPFFIVTFTLLADFTIGQDFANKALTLHNNYRSLHGAPPLEWSHELQKAATEHANYLASRNLPLGPSTSVDWGQNLFELRSRGRSLIESSDAAVLDKALDTWYKGIAHYNWANPAAISRSSLSFTQLLWMSTRKVGVGIGKSPAHTQPQRIIIVAMYDPPGNARGEFAANVLQKAKNGVIKVIPGSQITTTAPPTILSPAAPILSSSTVGSIGSPEVTTPALILTPPSSSFSPSTSSLFPSSPVPEIIEPISENPAITGLELHNQFRRKHGTPALELDPKLSQQAETYARAVLNGNRATQQRTPGLGRNVFQMSGSQVTPAEAVQRAVKNWYGHVDEYNWTSPLKSGYYANLFTQMVWKGSQKLGIGVASSGTGITRETVIVAYYSPAGNVAVEESYRENVFPQNGK